MARSPTVTRKRSKENNDDRSVVRSRRYGSESVVVDRRNKLLRAIPKRIPGVKGLFKSEVKSDLKEMRAFRSMEVQDAEEVIPKGTMVTPRPLIPKANHLEEKRARLARWENDPSLVERDMAEKREAISRAEDKDALMKAQQETWEQGYLVLREHLMARHRPTASWSRTAEVTSSPNSFTPATGADASNKFPVLATGEMKAASQENSRASDVGDDESSDRGNSRCNNGNVAVDIDSRKTGELLGSPDAARGGGAVWSCEGEEEEEEASLRELEQVVMKRAGLEGEFDMKKVIEVLTDRSRQVMCARRERASLLAQHQPHSQKKKDNGNDEAKRGLDNAHPGDIALLGRWKELLRVGDLVEMGRRASNGVDDAINEASDAEEALLRTKSASLLIPRGLDLPPSMRAPRYPTLLQQLHQEQQQQKKHEGATRAKETSRYDSSDTEMELDNSESSALLTVAKRTAGAMESVPWLGIGGYNGGVDGAQVVPTVEEEVATKGPNSVQTVASVERCIGNRVQWFPRSVPMEMATSEGGYDERQSAYYISKTSQATDRLRNLMREMAKRQEEIELRRRQKVEESVRLVRAAADHEKLRQEHLKRMKSLKKQLKKLEAAKRSSSAASAANKPGGESANDTEAKGESSSREDQGEEGRETILFYKPNPAPGSISASASASNADTDIDTSIGTASDDGCGGAIVTDAAGTAAYAAAPSASSGHSHNVGYQQHQQAARGSRREEDAASPISSIPPTSPPSSSSRCPSPSSGAKKGVVELREGDEALFNGAGGDGGSGRSEDKGSDRGGDGEGGHGDKEKEENGASDSKDPPAGVFFKRVAGDSRKRAFGEEAGGGVAARVMTKRRRSADVVAAMSANDKIGSGRNAPTAFGETPGDSLLSTRKAVVQASAASDSNSMGNDPSTGALDSRGRKSKAKTTTSAKRVGSTRLGSRGRRGGRK